MGDMNCKIGKGNQREQRGSYSGRKMMMEIVIRKNKLMILNEWEKQKGCGQE